MESIPQSVLRLLKHLNTPQKPNEKEKKLNQECAIIDSMLNVCLHHCLSITTKQQCKINSENVAEYVYKCVKTALNTDTKDTLKHNETEYRNELLTDLTTYNINTDLRWTHVVWNLALLESLNVAINAAMVVYNKENASAKEEESAKTACKASKSPTMSPDTLSMGEQKWVIAGVQFIVGLGILPCLQPGVGVPIENRANYGFMLMDTGKQLSEKEKEWRLFYCLKSLLQLIQKPSLGALILSSEEIANGKPHGDIIQKDKSFFLDKRNLSDIFAGLLQLCCASSLKKRTKATEEGQQKVNGKDEYCGRQITADDVTYCEDELKKLLEKVYPPMVVRELLVLQGGMPVRGTQKDGKMMLQRCPPWLRRACGKLLTDVLVKPKGVQFLLRGMLSGAEGEGIMDWKKCEAVGKLIAHCPKQSRSVEQYYQSICPQILDLLHLKDKQLIRQFGRVAVSTITLMVAQQPELTGKYILQPVMQPLMKCVEKDTSFKEGEVISPEKEIEQCMEDIHKVFVTGSEPHSVLLSSLKEVIHCVFKLYCAVHNGVSHHKKKVEEILLAFLKQFDKDLSILRLFAFEDVSAGIPFMNKDIQFQPGDSGGIQAVCATSTTDWESRVQIVVELLQKLNNDQMSADLFIYLLKELTTVLSEEIQVQAPVAKPSELLEEIQATDKLERLQRNLMLLSLLAGMCENLGHTCFKSTTHILQFVRVTLDRCVMVLQNTRDEELGIFESETVTMAMGLLTAVMSGAAQVSTSDREKTKDLLPLLETLAEDHPDLTVQEMATDLRIAIATHGFVLSDSLRKNFDSNMASEEDFNQLGQEIDCKISHINIDEKSERKNNEKIKLNINENDSEPNSTDKCFHKKPLIEVLSTSTNGHESAQNKAVSGKDRHMDNKVSNRGETSNLRNSNHNNVDTLEISGNDKTESAQKKPLIEVLSSSSNGNETLTTDSYVCSSENGTSKSSKNIVSVSNECDVDRNVETLSEEVSRNEREYRDNYKPGRVQPQHTSGLEQAFEELLDPLIPVRGHALISLRRLIEQKDQKTIEKQETLLKIFHENLDHGDTYIYLSAIQGLAALVERLPQKIVGILAEEYANFDRNSEGDGRKTKKRSPQLRMKIGEVMVKSIRELGDLAPQYRDVLLNSILTGALDNDHLVRASAVSNLGELCKLLRFSIGNIIYRVLDCVSSLVKTDPEVEVRRSAAMFVTLLLQGLGQNAVKILDSALRDLYHLLKFVNQVERDDLVKVHVQLALEELDKIMKNFLFPTQTLQKKISVLDPPQIGL